jgi:hypothetical protein
MIIDQIANANGSDKPFSYFWGTSFWSEELYSDLVSSLPPIEQYESFYHRDAVNDYGSTRYRLILDKSGLGRIEQGKRGIWWDLVETLKSKSFQEVVYHKLGVSRSVPSRIEVLLYRDISGYKISPHTDKRKIITTQFYLPKDDSIEEVGTELYLKSGKEEFTIYKKMKFLPRYGYGFAVSDRSWHGVSTISKAGVVRDSLMAIFYTA